MCDDNVNRLRMKTASRCLDGLQAPGRFGDIGFGGAAGRDCNNAAYEFHKFESPFQAPRKFIEFFPKIDQNPFHILDPFGKIGRIHMDHL